MITQLKIYRKVDLYRRRKKKKWSVFGAVHSVT